MVLVKPYEVILAFFCFVFVFFFLFFLFRFIKETCQDHVKKAVSCCSEIGDLHAQLHNEHETYSQRKSENGRVKKQQASI